MRHMLIKVWICITALILCSCSGNVISDIASPSSIDEKTTVLLSVQPICQNPDYPTGCEAAAAVTALQYFGDNITIAEFIDNYLRLDSTFYRKGIHLYGPNPNEVFIGDPRSTSSYGCFSPVIKEAIERRLSNNAQIVDTAGVSLSDLCRDYIDNNLPVILWATSDMKPVKYRRSWRLSDGSLFKWPSGEHCLLLVGYDATDYFFCDPHYTKIVSYSHKSVSLRYQELGCQSLVIKPYKTESR